MKRILEGLLVLSIFTISFSNGIVVYNTTVLYGEITSPNFPNKPPLNTYDTWIINIAKGNTIELIFHTFDVKDPDTVDSEASTSCFSNYVIIDIDGGKKFYCNKKHPSPLVTDKASRIRILFKYTKDSDIQRFNAIFQITPKIKTTTTPSSTTTPTTTTTPTPTTTSTFETTAQSGSDTVSTTITTSSQTPQETTPQETTPPDNSTTSPDTTTNNITAHTTTSSPTPRETTPTSRETTPTPRETTPTPRETSPSINITTSPNTTTLDVTKFTEKPPTAAKSQGLSDIWIVVIAIVVSVVVLVAIVMFIVSYRNSTCTPTGIYTVNTNRKKANIV